MDTHELAAKLAKSWVNGNRNNVIREIAALSGIHAAAVSTRMVLLLHNGHDVPTDLAMFTSRLEYEACGK